jgi:hypothetical protein
MAYVLSNPVMWQFQPRTYRIDPIPAHFKGVWCMNTGIRLRREWAHAGVARTFG